MSRASRLTRWLPTILLFLRLGFRVIVTSSLLLLYHPFLNIDVLIGIGKVLIKVTRELLQEEEEEATRLQPLRKYGYRDHMVQITPTWPL